MTPHCPQQDGMVERLIRTLQEQCVHRRRLETQQHAMRVIADWIQFYNDRRPHQALAMKTPAEAYAFAASPVQKPLGHYTSAVAAPHRKKGVGKKGVRDNSRHRSPSIADTFSPFGSPSVDTT